MTFDIDDAVVFTTPSGALALSLDGGETLVDPRGRRVAAVGVWAETDRDAREAFDAMTDAQVASLATWLDSIAREMRQTAAADASRVAGIQRKQAAAAARDAYLNSPEYAARMQELRDATSALFRAIGL